MRFRTLIPSALLAVFLLFYSSCKNGGVEPPPDNNRPDTTSHDFTWQIDTLGAGNGSILYDVANIDANNIWAVGELYLKDSAGQYSGPAFNAARWDGGKWNLVKILVRDYGTVTGYFPLKAVFAFGLNDVWFASSADLIQWNGTSFVSKAFFMTSIPFDGQVAQMWGTSSSNLYCVGRTGAIYHFIGSSWQKLSSGTTLDVRGIWGATANAETEILAVAANSSAPLDRSILRVSGTSVQTLADSGIIKEPLSGVWFSMNKKYYVVGSGIYRKNSLNDTRWTGAPLELTAYYSSDVSGNDTNDVVVVGAFGDLLHYNASTWKQYPELRINGSFYSVSFVGNTVVAVGYTGNRAIAVIGRRQ